MFRSQDIQVFVQKTFCIQVSGAKSQIHSNLANCPNYSITNYVEIPVFHFFEKVNKGHLKLVNGELLKKVLSIEPKTC